MKHRRQLIAISILLALPLILFLLRYYMIHPPGLLPTGFTQGDNLVYISNARQHIEQDSFDLAYSNPFSHTAGSPAIYSQPINYLFGLFLLIKTDPGLIITITGLISAILCIYFTLSLIHYLYPGLKSRYSVYLLSIWGGGLTAFAGLIHNAFFSPNNQAGIRAIFRYDPGEGWWGLNLGKSLFLPMEAFYHFLFITCIFFLVKRRWVAAIVLSFILCWSHPFTGIEYVGIVLGWLFVEKMLVRNLAIPWTFIAGFVLLAVGHLIYYLYYLNSFPEHRSLFRQFSINWSYDYKSFIPGYILAASLALITIYICKPRNVFGKEHQRLFFCWAVVAFLFSKHDWFIQPIQPLHFTRGYIWWGLILFSIPALSWLLKKASNRLAAFAIILIFLSDNILWLSSLLTSRNSVESISHVSIPTRQVLDWLQTHTTTNDLLISNEELVSYMSNAYASAYSWAGHNYNTPFVKDKKDKILLFFEKGVTQPEWTGRRLLVLVKRGQFQFNPDRKPAFCKLYANNEYEILTIADRDL